MCRPLANVKTLRAWRAAVRQRGEDLMQEINRFPDFKSHWNESVDAQGRRAAEIQIEVGLLAIDGLATQAIERHLNGETGSR